jgi:hypothetical protein
MIEGGSRTSTSRSRRAPADAKEMEAMARRVWQERGIVILWPDKISDEWDRQHVLNIAGNLYGKR